MKTVGVNVADLEKYRKGHPLNFPQEPGADYGWFEVDGPCGSTLYCMSSGWVEQDWYHVSVSKAGKKPPNWEEMSFIKNLFFGDAVVVQYHPLKRDYVNNAPSCLHLWQYLGGEIPTPPVDYVGFRSATDVRTV